MKKKSAPQLTMKKKTWSKLEKPFPIQFQSILRFFHEIVVVKSKISKLTRFFRFQTFRILRESLFWLLAKKLNWLDNLTRFFIVFRICRICRILLEIVSVIGKRDKLTWQFWQDFLGFQTFRILRVSLFWLLSNKLNWRDNLSIFFIVFRICQTFRIWREID